jgi:hypothetical protein
MYSCSVCSLFIYLSSLNLLLFIGSIRCFHMRLCRGGGGGSTMPGLEALQRMRVESTRMREGAAATRRRTGRTRWVGLKPCQGGRWRPQGWGSGGGPTRRDEQEEERRTANGRATMPPRRRLKRWPHASPPSSLLEVNFLGRRSPILEERCYSRVQPCHHRPPVQLPFWNPSRSKSPCLSICFMMNFLLCCSLLQVYWSLFR